MAKIRGLDQRAKAHLLKDLEEHRAVVKNRTKKKEDAEPLILAVCRCGTNMLVHMPRTTEPTVQLCPDCAATEIAKAQAEGKTVKVIHRPRVAKHVWRTNDNQEHPVTVTKETRMTFDLNSLTDAELGAIVRKRMLEQQAAKMEAEAPVVRAEKAKAEKKATKEFKKARKAEKKREERVTQIMAAFDCSHEDAIKELAKFEAMA